jgi:hypothetical protein
MDDDSRALDKGWDALPGYSSGPGEADEAVTVSVSTAPGEWLVNTTDSVVVPMSMVEVVEALRAQKLTDRSLVWRAGMQEWQPVDRVPQLKLAARMSAAPSVAPAATRSRPPPPKSSRDATARHPTLAQSASPLPLASQRATLPGLPPPGKSRPSNPRLAAPRPASPPPAGNDDSEVLAVYARPAATISFELAPEPAPQSEAPALRAPHTLAPLTADNEPRRPPPARNADLSVVAASEFRQVQRSSQRLLWLCSLGSAAAASLLTLWLSRSPSPSKAAAAAPSAGVPIRAVVSQPAPPPAAAPTPSMTAEPAPVTQAIAKPKPKAKRKARVAVARPAAPAVVPAVTTAPGAAEPSAEPNPYDVKLEEDPPPPAKAAPSEGSAPEAPSATTDEKPAGDPLLLSHD